MNSRCRKVCHPSRAKARKRLRQRNGRRNNHCKVIYRCDQPHHKGMYHLTSRRVPNVKAKEQAMDPEQHGEGEEQEEKQGQHRRADVQAVQDPALVAGPASLHAQEVSDSCRGYPQLP